MTQSDMNNPEEDDLLTKLDKLKAGTLYVSYVCRNCGQRFTTGDWEDKEVTCPVCDGRADRVRGKK